MLRSEAGTLKPHAATRMRAHAYNKHAHMHIRMHALMHVQLAVFLDWGSASGKRVHALTWMRA